MNFFQRSARKKLCFLIIHLLRLVDCSLIFQYFIHFLTLFIMKDALFLADLAAVVLSSKWNFKIPVRSVSLQFH